MDSLRDAPDTSDTLSKVREGLAQEVERQAKDKASEIDTREATETALIIVGATAAGVVLTGATSYLIDALTN